MNRSCPPRDSCSCRGLRLPGAARADPPSPPQAGIDLKGFEQSLDELEKLVARLEEGNLSLEETLGEFERGMRLHGQCQQALDQAQQRVELMLKSSGYQRSVPFDAETP